MMKLKNLALCAFAILPAVAMAQTGTPATAQTETASDHQADWGAQEDGGNRKYPRDFL